MGRRIWILGSSNIDTTYLVDEMPRKGDTIKADCCFRSTGGKGANQAVTAAHWGADVSFIGAVGNDPDGQILIEAVRSKGIDMGCFSVVKDMPSGNAVIFVDEKGQNCIVVYPGANKRIPLDLTPDIKEGDFLSAQNEVDMEALEYYFSYAKSKKATTIFNPSPFLKLPDSLLKSTDIIIVNENEASLMSGIIADSPGSAKLCGIDIQKRGPSVVIVTLGVEGVAVIFGKTAYHIPGIKVNTVDTQGAGDVFSGAFVCKLSYGEPVLEAAAYANIAAALSVTKKGSAQISLPDPDDVRLKTPIKTYNL